jgi:lipopolysaccharide transport system permease protein
MSNDTASVTVIEPRRGWITIPWRELWSYRELLYFFAWRDLKVRYKQTLLGASWAVLKPFLTMVVFTVFFGRFIGVSSEGVPYPLFSYAAILPWGYFSHVLSQSSQALVDQRHLVTKIYFPRLLLILAPVVSGLVDFLIAFLVLAGMMGYYGVWPDVRLWVLPFLLLLAMGGALGVGLWLAVLHVRFRDVRHIVPFVVQLWLFATPVIYSRGVVPERWRFLYDLNPMVGVVEGFRWALLGTGSVSWDAVALSLGVVGVLLVSGLIGFHRLEGTFADLA